MKKSLAIYALGTAALLATGCGDEADDPVGPALLHTEAEPAGANCAAGGTRVVAGTDSNGNGTLDGDEGTQVHYVCNGAPGRDGTDGDAGPVGSDGSDGRDGDDGRDGADGADGRDGNDGSDGEDGRPVLVTITAEPAGAHCASGGQKVETGLDLDRDGVLDDDEVTATAYVCDGADGGVAGGFRLVSKFTTPGGPIAEIVDASANGMLLAYTSSVDGLVGFVDLTDPASPALLGTVDVSTVVAGGEPTSVALRADGTHAAVAIKNTTDPVGSADAGALAILDVATRTVVGHVLVGVGPDSIHLTPDGLRAVIAIEDEEDADNNGVAQQRPGSVQIVTIDWANPAASQVTTVTLQPPFGNLPTDPQPEYVDITADGSTAIVSLQENNLVAVIDLATATVLRYIDAGHSAHARADLADDGAVDFSQGYEGVLEPDSVCLLADGHHFVSANEGDTPHGSFGAGLSSGGRGFSVFDLDGNRVYDSGDAAEWLAVRAGAYPDGRSDNRGVEFEGCGTGVFAGREFAFLLGERNASLYVVDVADPAAPVLAQLLGAPMRPEGIVTIPARNLVVVGGEGDGTGGGIWIYEAVSDPDEAGLGPDVYEARSARVPFSALGALAWDASSGLLLATPDNAFATQRVWSFWIDHGKRRMDLVNELVLRDGDGLPLTGYDPEALVVNPEGGLIVASEGIAGNGAAAPCVGSVQSNRLLFFDAAGRLDGRYGNGGIVDLPCGSEANAIDWSTVRGNGFEGVTVVDTLPGQPGGLVVYAAIQRGLTNEGQLARIGAYHVDTGTWDFWFYPLDANPGGAAGNTFLSELIHVAGDTFAVIERDQGWAGDAGNKTIRTFRLSTGTANDAADPVEKVLVADLLATPFRFDQEKLEGLAVGGGALWVTNDNDGGEALNYFVKLDPSILGAGAGAPAQTPGADAVVINEVNSSGTDHVELHNLGTTAVDLGGWKLTDSNPGNVFVFPAGTSLPASGYLVVGGTSSLALPFGLGSSDAIRLYTPQDVLVGEHSWTAHVAVASRCPTFDGTAFWAPTAATPGAANDCTPPTVPGETAVRINEVNSSGADFVELVNTGSTPVDVSGWVITDADPSHRYVLPPATSIAAGGILLVEGDSSSGPIRLTFGLGSTDSAILYTPFDVLVDRHDWTGHVASAGRCPDGSGAFVAMSASPGAANTCP